MDEFNVIESIKQKAYRQKTVIKGIGDDATVLRSSQHDLVIAVDTFVENVHFTKQTLTPWQIGYRALAANLSDLAAMGATPLYYLVSVVIPPEKETAFILDIFQGMDDLAKQYQIDLVGGDTVSGGELAISVTVFGEVERGKARYRQLARPGDIIFVTGTLGDAQAGLELLLAPEKYTIKGPLQESLILRHQQPTPRVEFARALLPLKRVALNDISDGISNELHEIATSSGVTLIIEDAKIPLSEGLMQFPRNKRDAWKLFAGEDFELLGTVPKEDFAFVKEIGRKLSVKVTEIGYVTYNRQGRGQVFIKKAGRLERLKKLGYVHRN